MSSWTDAEVAELQAKGNDYARRTWLKNAPPIGQGGRPKEGDHVDVFKRFVVDVYERRRYYGEDSGAPPAPAPQQVAVAVPVSKLASSVSFAVAPPQRRAPPPMAAPKPPAPAPVASAADLLDFSSSTLAPQAAAANTNMFQANFDAFASSTPATAPSSTAAPLPSAFSFIKPPPPAPPAPPAATSNDFADFAGMASTPAPAATPVTGTKKPVMSNQSMSEKASLISAMDSMPFGSNPQGFGGMQQRGNFGMQQQQPMNMMQQNMMAQQQMMMQQQQQMMMQGMNPGMGMGMNTMNTGTNMMNQGMGMGVANPMMNRQQMMGFGGTGMSTPSNNNNANSMNSLQMNMSSMNDWTTGGGTPNNKKSF